MPVPLPPVAFNYTLLVGVAGASKSIPLGSRGWTINVSAGTGCINNGALIPSPFSFTTYDTVAQPLVVAVTGAVPSAIVVGWQTPVNAAGGVSSP